MRWRGIACGGLLFACGLGLGFWLGRSPPGITEENWDVRERIERAVRELEGRR